MGSIRTSEGICRLSQHLVFYCLHVSRGQHHITIEHNQILSLGMLCPIVACLSRSAVLLRKVMKINLTYILIADLLAGYLTTVFYDDHLKVLQGLLTQTLE